MRLKIAVSVVRSRPWAPFLKSIRNFKSLFPALAARAVYPFARRSSPSAAVADRADCQPPPGLRRLFDHLGCGSLLRCLDHAGPRNRLLSCGNLLLSRQRACLLDDRRDVFVVLRQIFDGLQSETARLDV